MQLEEAAARATVALTRARELCVILGPLDMLWLIGAATVIGSLMYGVGICWKQSLELHYQQEESEAEMTDEKMVHMIQQAGPCAQLPPLVLAEIVQLQDDEFIVRRLHLIIVDTWRQKWLNREVISQLRTSIQTVVPGTLTSNSTPVRLTATTGKQQHQVRFVYGYALDGSTYPCYCMCPVRAEDESFQLVDSATGYIYSMSQTAAVKPLGVAHFYDAFSIGHELDLWADAARAFALPETSIKSDLSVAAEWAQKILPSVGQAGFVPAEDDDNASVVSVASSGAPAPKRADETDSDASPPSEANDPTTVVDLITDEDESDAESEEDFELSEKELRFLHEAYEEYANYGVQWLQQREHSQPGFRTPFAEVGNVQAAFEMLINLPDSWPLMRILIPLDGLSLQAERIVACVAAELVATHRRPGTQTKFVKRVAKKLTAAVMASYLAGEVASILSPVASWEHREMVAPMYQPLLTPVFWVRPIYTELFHASSRLKKDNRVETARPPNGLVKIMCSPKALGEEPPNATADNKGLTHWIGSASHVQALYVWVPAHWTTSVYGVVKARTTQFDARRDYELEASRAWHQIPDQQLQRDGAGIGNATLLDGAVFFLKSVDLRPGTKDIPSFSSEHRGWSYQLRISSILWARSIKGFWMGSFDKCQLLRGSMRCASVFRWL